MTTALQPRDAAGRFAPYVRPPVPPARSRNSVTAAVAPPAPAEPTVRRLFPEVPTSVVAVCCPECVYGEVTR